MNPSGFKQGLPPIPNNIGEITGPPFLGIVLNWCLFGVLTLQYYLYYLHFPNDRWFLKLAVHFIFLVELAQTILTVVNGFHWFVFGFGDINKLNEFFLANFETPILGGIIALVVQGMYAWWVYHLSKLRIVTGFIGFCTITQLVGALGIGIANQEAGTIMKSQPRFKAFQIIWTLFNVASDILIAGTMTWLLLASRGWKNEGERSTVVTKIVRFTVETNVASSAVAIAMFLTMVIPSIGPPKGVFFLTPGYVLGKLHSNSFMAMLNNRSLIKRDIIRNQIDHPSSRQQQWNQGVVQRAAVTLPAASFSHDDVRPPGSYIPTDFKRRDTEVNSQQTLSTPHTYSFLNRYNYTCRHKSSSRMRH